MSDILSYDDLKAEYRIMACSDPWGDAMHFWFSIADEIYFNRDSLFLPEEWRYRPSPLGSQNDPDDYATQAVCSASDDALERFGTLINRYCRLLRHLGKDY